MTERKELVEQTTEALLDALSGAGLPAELKAMIDKGQPQKVAEIKPEHAADYHQLFSTPLGRVVLEDMVERFLLRGHYIPGSSRPDDAVFGAGVQAVVHDILVMIVAGTPAKEEG